MVVRFTFKFHEGTRTFRLVNVPMEEKVLKKLMKCLRNNKLQVKLSLNVPKIKEKAVFFLFRPCSFKDKGLIQHFLIIISVCCPLLLHPVRILQVGTIQ